MGNSKFGAEWATVLAEPEQDPEISWLTIHVTLLSLDFHSAQMIDQPVSSDLNTHGVRSVLRDELCAAEDSHVAQSQTLPLWPSTKCWQGPGTAPSLSPMLLKTAIDQGITWKQFLFTVWKLGRPGSGPSRYGVWREGSSWLLDACLFPMSSWGTEPEGSTLSGALFVFLRTLAPLMRPPLSWCNYLQNSHLPPH